MKTVIIHTMMLLVILSSTIIMSNAIVEDKSAFIESVVWEIKGHLFQAIENKKNKILH